MVTPMRPVHSHVRMRGFTATEILVVVAIVGIITAIAAPNMAQMIRNQRVKTAAFDVFASFTFARSEAVKRNTAVTITPIGAADWTQGWRITDANGNLLKEESDRKTYSASALVMAGPASVTFARSGRLGDAAAPRVNLSAYGGVTRCVTVDLSGRPRTC